MSASGFSSLGCFTTHTINQLVPQNHLWVRHLHTSWQSVRWVDPLSFSSRDRKEVSQGWAKVTPDCKLLSKCPEMRVLGDFISYSEHLEFHGHPKIINYTVIWTIWPWRCCCIVAYVRDDISTWYLLGGRPVDHMTFMRVFLITRKGSDTKRLLNQFSGRHPEGTSNGSDICDFSKNSHYNGCLWDINFFPLKIILNDTTQFREDLMEIYI